MSGRLAAVWSSLVCLAVLCGSAGAAQTVQLNLGDGVLTRAEYHEGRADRPAVVFVHDFLATAETPLVEALARRLRQSRVDFLVPTLSLGIAGRGAPLACEAVHTHLFEQDMAELRQWVEWLLGKGRTRIVLVGQRFGGWQALALTEHLLSPALQAVVMVSPQASPVDTDGLPALRAAANAGGRELLRRRVLDCKTYVGPADSIYSYARWDAVRMLAAVDGARLPVRAIVGGRDPRLDAAWRSHLSDAGALVQLVPDATDFKVPRHLASLLELIVASLIIEG